MTKGIASSAKHMPLNGLVRILVLCFHEITGFKGAKRKNGQAELTVFGSSLAVIVAIMKPSITNVIDGTSWRPNDEGSPQGIAPIGCASSRPMMRRF